MIRSLPVLGFASLLVLAASGARATDATTNDKPTFLISARDGYGVAECLTRGDECSLQMANAWCAAQGYHHASDLRVMVAEGGRTMNEEIAVTCDN
ncbi:hypothetical protein [Pseudochelatococcus contaminans]|uniref:Uncharacterized protein n=1 Tax=Pseudochelatococcus contaminans TaxID=1538103 RepID=A0A7W5Z1A7_9HYPH|nr:hypothetical protein [Pseudochelatococcus contaminans]MBB3808240.1 hypothetical protein [Pseudochelatococcus contaminans]